MDIRSYNRDAWNKEADGGENRWTKAVDAETIAKARNGQFGILLTENIHVPARWFPPLKGADVLCLASGGDPCFKIVKSLYRIIKDNHLEVCVERFGLIQNLLGNLTIYFSSPVIADISCQPRLYPARFRIFLNMPKRFLFIDSRIWRVFSVICQVDKAAW